MSKAPHPICYVVTTNVMIMIIVTVVTFTRRMRITIRRASAGLGLDNVKAASRTLDCLPSEVSSGIDQCRTN